MAVSNTLKLTKTPSDTSIPSDPNRHSTNPNNIKKIMEQFGQYRQQAQQQAHGSVINVRNWLVQAINNTSESLRHYINKYPPLAAFLFTLIILSAVPVACFTVFTFVTSAVFLTIALIGFGFVEGLCLMAGGGVLLAVLGGIALVTTIGFTWVSMVYVTWRGGSYVACKMMEGGSQLGQKTQEAISQMQQQYHQPGSTPSYQPQSSMFSSAPTGTSTSPAQQPM